MISYYHIFKSTKKSWMRRILKGCVVCVGQKRHAPPPLLAALAFSPLLAASGRHSMGDDSPWSSVSPPGLPATQFPLSALSPALAFCDFLALDQQIWKTVGL